MTDGDGELEAGCEVDASPEQLSLALSVRDGPGDADGGGDALELGQGENERLPDVEGVLERLTLPVTECGSVALTLAVEREEGDASGEKEEEADSVTRTLALTSFELTPVELRDGVVLPETLLLALPNSDTDAAAE